MSIRHLGRSIGREDADVEFDPANATTVTEVETAAATGEMAADVGDPTSDSVSAHTEALDEMVEDSAELTEQAEVVEKSIDPEGTGEATGEGLSEVALESIRISLARKQRRWGIESSRRPMPGVESVAGHRASRTTKLQAGRAALESIGETIANIWKKIKEFFKSLWAKITNTVRGALQNSIKTEKRANELLKEISLKGSKDGWTKKETRVKGSAGKVFSEDNKANATTATNIIERHLKTVADSANLNKDTDDLVKHLNNVVAQINSNATIYITDLTNQVDHYTTKVMNSLGKANVNANDVKEDIGMDDSDMTIQIYAAGPFINGKILYAATGTKPAKDGVDATVTYRAGWTIPKNHREQAEADTLGQNEMVSICQLAKKIAQAMGAFERAKKVGDSVSADLEKVIEAAIKAANTNVDANAASAAKQNGSNAATRIRQNLAMLQGIVHGLIKTLSVNNAELPVMALSAANHGLDYVAASLRATGKK